MQFSQPRCYSGFLPPVLDLQQFRARLGRVINHSYLLLQLAQPSASHLILSLKALTSSPKNRHSRFLSIKGRFVLAPYLSHLHYQCIIGESCTGENFYYSKKM